MHLMTNHSFHMLTNYIYICHYMVPFIPVPRNITKGRSNILNLYCSSFQTIYKMKQQHSFWYCPMASILFYWTLEDHQKDTQIQNLLTIPQPLDLECLIEVILYITSALDGYILLFQIHCNEILSVDECFSHIHIDINISLSPCGFSYLLTCVDHFFVFNQGSFYIWHYSIYDM